MTVDLYFAETRYESYLPGDKWYRKKPFTYASNPRWGDAFQIRSVGVSREACVVCRVA